MIETYSRSRPIHTLPVNIVHHRNPITILGPSRAQLLRLQLQLQHTPPVNIAHHRNPITILGPTSAQLQQAQHPLLHILLASTAQH